MSDIAALARCIDRDRIERAKAMSPAEKFLAGAELFEEACVWSIAGIRMQNPGYNEEEIRKELRRRLDIGKTLKTMRPR